MSRLDDNLLGEGRRPGSAIAREPVVTSGLIGVLVLDLCVLLRQFGVPLTPDQHNAITAVVGTLVVLGGALLARRHTTPVVDPHDRHGRPLVADAPPPPPAGGGPLAAGPDYPIGG